ncbi:GH32 C-terminal domain-containing protein [Litchfieldia salsa]|uniref:beta-fructofuranosidase n=1 Tax=Litchfieldia salsa TaxID=930152 RepID=A0A1H0WRH1_9BACI|nr:GH32 C-terminal domain-containing protein [Litchfieldia salsa]SDP93278.1 Sucrose-6-phosphate hydrolase SacC, GH32 family [Litchfieldia salsa]
MSIEEKGKGLIAHWSFDEGKGSEVTDEIQGKQYPIHYVFKDNHTHLYQDPQWRNGIKGSSLLFDGYSTWIERKGGIISEIEKEFTVEAWVAPRSFGGNEDERLTAVINQHNLEKKQGFILGIHRHGKWSLQIGTNQNWIQVWADGYPLPKNKWSYITATFNGVIGIIRLYLNGEKVAEGQIEANSTVSKCEENLLIGKNNHPIWIEDVFSLNMFSGLIDDVKVHNRELSSIEVYANYKSYLSPFNGEIPYIPYHEICIERNIYDSDYHRPKYHLTAPGLWMNEPHSPLYFKGKYHLFYQHNPHGPYWGNIQWGHWVSEDLVHWRDLPIALETEDDGLAPDGIWSGNAAYDEEGLPVLFFTAGNLEKTPNQMVGLARCVYEDDGDLNLTNWVKHPTPIIVQPQGLGLHYDGFRDPFVWKEGDTWYQIVGSGIEGKCGTAIVFTSTNLVDWDYRGLLYDDLEQNYPYLGEVWELPILFPIGEGKHIFIISPVGIGADVEVFYWIGKWDKDQFRFIPDCEEPQLMDLGDFNFTGPSAMIDQKTGRLILFTIAQGQRSLKEEYEAGWAHNGGLPVELWLRQDGRLGLKPIEELEALRGDKVVSIQGKSKDEVNEIIQGVKSNMLEIRLEIQAESATQFGIKVLKSPKGKEETLIFYDKEVEKLNVVKQKEHSPIETQGGSLRINGENMKLHIYLDCSMVECYANELKSLTTRVYSSSLDAKGLEIWGNGNFTVVSMDAWEMKSIHKS